MERAYFGKIFVLFLQFNSWMWGRRLSLWILLIGMINAVLKIFISMELPVWVFERPVLKCFQLPILQKWNFCLLEKWVGPQMQTWMTVLLHGETEQKRLAGPKQQKAKFKSALLYSNGFWYIYQQLWNVASGLFKIITNSNFSLRVHVNNNKKKPLNIEPRILFPFWQQQDLLSHQSLCIFTPLFIALFLINDVLLAAVFYFGKTKDPEDNCFIKCMQNGGRSALWYATLDSLSWHFPLL